MRQTVNQSLLAVPTFPRGSHGLELVVAAAIGLGPCSPPQPHWAHCIQVHYLSSLGLEA